MMITERSSMTSLPLFTMSLKEPGDYVVKLATKFIGIREKSFPDNSEWVSKTKDGNLETNNLTNGFSDGIRKVGWTPGIPYCMFSAKFWYYQGHLNYISSIPDVNDKKMLKTFLESFMEIIKGSTLTTFNNINNIKLISDDPEPGALVFFKNDSNGGYHAGIVIKLIRNTLFTIEANTLGLDEENHNEKYEGVEYKKRELHSGNNNMRVMGYFNPLNSTNLGKISEVWNNLKKEDPQKFNMITSKFKNVIEDTNLAGKNIQQQEKDITDPSFLSTQNLSQNAQTVTGDKDYLVNISGTAGKIFNTLTSGGKNKGLSFLKDLFS